MINLNQLRAFYQAAKCRNLSTAAKNLFVSQPAVTAQVKLFEEQCGLKLFKKKGRNLHLTDEGKIIFDLASRIFDGERELEDTLEKMKALKHGSLRLGSARTYARYFMPFLLTGFREAYPDIKIFLDEGSSAEMIHGLGELKNELIIVAQVVENENISFIPFSREELVLIMSPEHRLSREKSVAFEQLAKEPVIMKDRGSGTRRLVDELYAQNQCIPNVLMETSDAEVIKLLVQHGEGVSFLIKAAVNAELKTSRLASVPINGQKIFLDVSVAHLKNQSLSPSGQAFLKSLEDLKTRKMHFQGMGDLMQEMIAQQK